MLIGYARVSTPEQALSLQEDALKQAGCKKIYSEIASGAKAERIQLQNAIDQCREGDTLVVWKLDVKQRAKMTPLEGKTASKIDPP